VEIFEFFFIFYFISQRTTNANTININVGDTLHTISDGKTTLSDVAAHGHGEISSFEKPRKAKKRTERRRKNDSNSDDDNNNNDKLQQNTIEILNQLPSMFLLFVFLVCFS
jgi:hypothetical protein